MARRGHRHHMSKRNYEKFMNVCINSLPFQFHSPGEPNIPKRPRQKKEHVYGARGVFGHARGAPRLVRPPAMHGRVEKEYPHKEMRKMEAGVIGSEGGKRYTREGEPHATYRDRKPRGEELQ